MGEMMKKKTAVVSAAVVNTDGTINAHEIYSTNCAKCHGEDGKAGITGASDLSATQLSNDSISSIILNGRKTMPKIEGLTSEQAQAVAAYVNTNIKGK